MRVVLVAALCLPLLTLQARAETVVLDDSASPRQQVSAGFEWVVPAPGANPEADDLFRLRAVVSGLEYRLDTSAFTGRAVRIYLHFPRNTAGLDTGGSARLTWRTRRVLTPGSASQGERPLVFDGVVDSALISETFDFTIDLDVRDVTGPFRLAPRFVLETQ